MMKNYSKESIRKLTECIVKSSQAYNWLIDNNYRELIALSNAINGNKAESRWLMENKFVHLAAFANAMLGDKNAFEWLHKSRIILWAATASIILNDDKQAYVLLKTKGYDHFLLLAQIIKKKLDIESMGDDEAMHKKPI